MSVRIPNSNKEYTDKQLLAEHNRISKYATDSIMTQSSKLALTTFFDKR